MKFNFRDIELTGKGFVVQDLSFRLLNLNMIADQATFYQLISADEHVGWLVLDQLEMIADYTIHTDSGMKGSSTVDELTDTLILDPEGKLDQISMNQLIELDITQAQLVLTDLLDKNIFLDRMRHPDVESNVNIDDALIFFSFPAEYILVQTEDTSVRIAGEDGIYILQEEGDQQHLTIINDRDGVMHYGESTNVQVNRDGIIIDDEKLDVHSILQNVAQSLKEAFSEVQLDLDF